jgi:UDP-3-O-[3-hydroxymyristoyl] glucosamine N-acyltransferase
MTWNLAEITSLVDGQLVGDASLPCSGANPPAQASEGEITLLDDSKQRDVIQQSAAIAVVVGEEIDTLDRPQIVVASPHQAFATIVSQFRPPITNQTGGDDSHLVRSVFAPSASIHPSAQIGFGVTIGQRTQIGPSVVIMPRCQIGDDCVIHANATLYEYTELSERVVIHSGTVIGANGFGYRQENGRHVPTAQLGYVAIESDVEIGAGVTIDRGSYGATRIGEGTKIDNQVQIAHNCQIGKHNLLCSQVGIAGSCSTGDYVILAGQVGLKDHVHLGDRAIVGAKAGVMEDLKGDQVYLGSPCAAQREQMQIFAVTRKLPEMRRELKQLRRELDKMKQEDDGNGRRAA